MSNDANDKDCVLSVKIVPNASSTEIVGRLGDAIKIRVQAPSENGKANKALIKFLSKQLQCDRKQIDLESGHFSPQKRLRIEMLTRTG